MPKKNIMQLIFSGYFAPPSKKQKLAHKIFVMLVKSGMSHDDMLKTLQMAREKIREMKENQL